MKRYDPYTDSSISDDIDLRSYMLGYLQGCEDSYKKYAELTKVQFSMTTADTGYEEAAQYEQL